MVVAKRKRVPGYLLHKARGTAKVVINGETHYLPGEYGSTESTEEYDRLIAEYLGKREQPTFSNVTVNRLCVAYLDFAETYYVKNGSTTAEVGGIRGALRPLVELYGKEPVAKLGPLRLKHVRERMIARGWLRKTINRNVKRIVRMLRWGVEQEWVPPHVLHTCQEVRNLQAGRCGDVPEGEPVLPVEVWRVDAVKPFLSRQVWAMIQLQLATGMRPQEARVVRWCDIDKSDQEAWEYVPRTHKMEHRNRNRRIYIGPNGQKILSHFLKADQTAYVFSPVDAEQERRESLRENRKSPMTPSQARRTKLAAPKRKPGVMYTKDSYNRAITRACEIAFGMPQELRSISPKLPTADQKLLKQRAKAWRKEWCWCPLQLRHTAGTELRKTVDLDAARQVLGHSEKSTTEIYAEKDFSAARETMRKFG